MANENTKVKPKNGWKIKAKWGKIRQRTTKTNAKCTSENILFNETTSKTTTTLTTTMTMKRTKTPNQNYTNPSTTMSYAKQHFSVLSNT